MSKIIAVNTRFLLANKLEGIGRFTYETLQRITQQQAEHQFVFLFDRPYHKKFIFSDNVRPMVLYPPARHPLLWYAWFEWAVPYALRKSKADAFLSTDGYASLRTKVNTTLVIHDLAFEHYPQQVPFGVRHYYQYFTPKYAHKAQQIAVVSEYTKTDLHEKYDVPLDKINVVYNGANHIYKSLSAIEKAAVRQTYTQGAPYFLFIGAIHPRKNLSNMLKAFDRLKSRTNCSAKFVVAGRKAWKSAKAFDTYNNMQHQNDVLFLGHIQLSVLAQVLGAATALVYASLFEGFGIPIVEAQYTDTPVITSTTSSMPEVGGDAALLVNPTNVSAIENAMEQLYFQPQLREKLIQKAQQHRQRFSWQKSADRLWQSVEKIL